MQIGLEEKVHPKSLLRDFEASHREDTLSPFIPHDLMIEDGGSAFDPHNFNYKEEGMLGIETPVNTGGAAALLPAGGTNQTFHSCAIPIQAAGRRSPLMAAPKGVPLKAVRLGGSAQSAIPKFNSHAMAYDFIPSSTEISAPMPSPNFNWHMERHRRPNGAYSAGLHFDTGVPQTVDELYAGTLSPGSPPPCPLSLSVPMTGGIKTTLPTQKPVAASPRSFSESIFSFRTGSLSTTEEVLARQRRRKENHNAVERRRRDMMNVLISRLSLLVTAGSQGLDPTSAEKLNKGEVLEAAVKRILSLNQVCLDLARQLALLDPCNPQLKEHEALLLSAVTYLPDNLGDPQQSPSPGHARSGALDSSL